VKWKSHIALTFSIISRHFKYFFNDDEFIGGLKEGLIEVDERSDLIAYADRGAIYWYKIPHHSPTSKKFAKYYAYLSLYFLRNGAQFMASKMLGRALHYIQDMAISPRAILQHSLIEDVIDGIVSKSVTRVQPIDNLDIDKIVSVKGSRDAEEAVRIATERTYLLLKWYEGESHKRVDSHKLLRKLKVMRICKGVMSALLITSVFTTAFLWLGPLGLTVLQFLCALIVAPLVDFWSYWYCLVYIFLFSLFIGWLIYFITSPIRNWRPKIYWDCFKAGLIRLKERGAIY